MSHLKLDILFWCDTLCIHQFMTKRFAYNGFLEPYFSPELYLSCDHQHTLLIAKHFYYTLENFFRKDFTEWLHNKIVYVRWFKIKSASSRIDYKMILQIFLFLMFCTEFAQCSRGWFEKVGKITPSPRHTLNRKCSKI